MFCSVSQNLFVCQDDIKNIFLVFLTVNTQTHIEIAHHHQAGDVECGHVVDSAARLVEEDARLPPVVCTMPHVT